MKVRVLENTTCNIQVSDISLAEKMQNCYKVAKSVYGNQFDKTVKIYKDILTGYKKENNTDTLHALIKILDDKEISSNPMYVILFMSAAVDMITTAGT